MKRFMKFGLAAVTLVGVLLLASSQAQAEVTWDSVVAKATTAKSYSTTYEYEGPKGTFKFDYRIIGPTHPTPKKPEPTTSQVRTKIVKGKNNEGRDVSNTVILYDGTGKKDIVLYKIGAAGTLPRKLSHKDVADTPFYKSIYGMILGEIGSQQPKVTAQGTKTMFKFPNYTVWANDKSEIIETKRTVNNEQEHREFSSHEWDNVKAEDIKF